MLQKSKNNFRKVLRNIIIIVFSFVLISLISTKAIYDSAFRRYKTQPLKSEIEAFSSLGAEPHIFKSEKNNLKGYFFDNNSDCLIVIATGFKSDSFDYFSLAKSFLSLNKKVFIFDTTGSGESEGNSSVGFSQAVIDLNSALDYINQNQNFGCRKLVLFGHSRGGYASCLVSEMRKDISAVISVAALNSAMEAVINPATDYIGDFAYIGYPFLWLYQASLFGGDIISQTAAESISQNSLPTLVIHGDNDKTVNLNKGSIFAHRDDISSDKVEYYISHTEGKNGHTDILFEEDGKANKILIDKIDEFLRKVV